MISKLYIIVTKYYICMRYMSQHNLYTRVLELLANHNANSKSTIISPMVQLSAKHEGSWNGIETFLQNCTHDAVGINFSFHCHSTKLQSIANPSNTLTLCVVCGRVCVCVCVVCVPNMKLC